MTSMIYLSAASGELDRAIAAMEYLRIGDEWGIAYDWTDAIRRERGGETVDLAKVAARCLHGVDVADALVALLPHRGVASRGLWVELGYAVARAMPIVLVGRGADADIWHHCPTVVTAPSLSAASDALRRLIL